MNIKPYLTLAIAFNIAGCQPSTEKQYEEANQYFSIQAYELAIPIYERLLIKDSKNKNLHPKLSISYAYAGNWDKCIEHAQHAFQNDVDYYQLYDTTVKCYDAKGEIENATKLYEEGIEKYPDRYEFQANYGRFNYQLGNFTKAAEIFAKISDIDPQNIEYAYNAAASFEAAENFAKAESFYLHILKEDAQHANANYGLGSIYDKQSQPEKAVLFFENTLKTNPQHLSALMNLARLQEAQKPQEALKNWQKYLSLAEQNQQPEKFINQAKEHIQRLGGGAPIPDENPAQDG